MYRCHGSFAEVIDSVDISVIIVHSYQRRNNFRIKSNGHKMKGREGGKMRKRERRRNDPYVGELDAITLTKPSIRGKGTLFPSLLGFQDRCHDRLGTSFPDVRKYVRTCKYSDTCARSMEKGQRRVRDKPNGIKGRCDLEIAL